MPTPAMTDKQRAALKVVDLAKALVLADNHFLSAAVGRLKVGFADLARPLATDGYSLGVEVDKVHAVQARKAAVAALDNSFRFLDGAFGEDAQEPLIFVTKLSADPVLIRLVANHGSGEYMKHNKSLLFTERGLDLLAEIEGLDK